MKIFMMSNIERVGNNKKIYNKFLKNCSNICYIPSWNSTDSKKDFKYFCKSVKKQCTEVSFIPVDKKINKKSKKSLEKADVIIIDGGNTFFLMKNLRKNGYFNVLKKQKNKTFVGVSAGAIALTKNISLAKIPNETADDNAVGLKNLKGLGFVEFEIHAHATNKKSQMQEVKEYSKKQGNRIYVCRDGQGIIVDENKVVFSGKVKEMNMGKMKQERAGGA